MPPEITPQPPQEQPELEALLIQNEQHNASIEKSIETLIHQNEKNNPEPILEAIALGQKDIVEAIKSADAAKEQRSQTVADTATVTVKGLKGDKGDTGEKGDKGDTGDQGPQGERGIDGPQGEPGVQGKTGNKGDIGPQGPQGDKGDIGPQGPKGDRGPAGRDGSADTGDDIVRKHKELPKKQRINYDDLAGLPNLDALHAAASKSIEIYDEQTLIEGNLERINFAGAGVQASSDGHGAITVVIPGGATPTIYTETPTGAINGVNLSYTTAHAIASIFSFAINGQFIHPADYVVAGSTITFGTPLDSSLSGLPFTIIYA
jgi:hypothetical protein